MRLSPPLLKTYNVTDEWVKKECSWVFQDIRQSESALGKNQVLWIRHGLHFGGVQISCIRNIGIQAGQGASGLNGLPFTDPGIRVRPPVSCQRPLV